MKWREENRREMKHQTNESGVWHQWWHRNSNAAAASWHIGGENISVIGGESESGSMAYRVA